MNLSVIPTEALPVLVDRAAKTLASARSSAEVLEARDAARLVYDATKYAGRMARAKEAHDDILQRVYRAQADALLIESRAKVRLADEYDFAQERGEVVGAHDGARKRVEGDNAITAADLGIRRDEIYEARKLRDAEYSDPGLIERTLNDLVDRGEEPTKAAIKHVHVSANSGNNEWYTPDEIIEAAREVLGAIDFDPASSEVANGRVRATLFFSEEDNGLQQTWPEGRVWMNPPYAQPLIAQFAEKFAIHMEQSHKSTGMVLVNNATETAWFQRLIQSTNAICFPRGRTKFLDPSGQRSGAPLQGQAILYSGSYSAKFQEVFSDFGEVLRGS